MAAFTGSRICAASQQLHRAQICCCQRRCYARHRSAGRLSAPGSRALTALPPNAEGDRMSRANAQAMRHFDQIYAEQFGQDWPSLRLALLTEPKRSLLLNNFSDGGGQLLRLAELGAENCADRLDAVLQRRSSSSSESFAPAVDRSPTPSSESESVRVVNYASDVGRAGLDEFVPATEIIGELAPKLRAQSEKELELVDFDLSDADLWLPCDIVGVPPGLRLVGHLSGQRQRRFPRPRADSNGLLPYLPLDLGSAVSAVALSASAGHSVLDACAAPGVKSLCALMSAPLSRLVCIDKSSRRVSRLWRLLTHHVPEYELLRCQATVTHADALQHPFDAEFDRVLIDAPCSTDRHALNDPGMDLFGSGRAAERRGLPDLQLRLLKAGAAACAVGGDVVYSTCTLSPVQNELLVCAALQQLHAETDIRLKIVDLAPLAESLVEASLCRAVARPAGLLVVPHLLDNYGPSYVCKLRRIR